MNEILVSIRMPDLLYQELKAHVREGRFMDLSEEIRSIVRRKWLEARSPELFLMRRLEKDIRQEVAKRGELLAQKHVLIELEKIRQDLRKGNMEAGL